MEVRGPGIPVAGCRDKPIEMMGPDLKRGEWASMNTLDGIPSAHRQSRARDGSNGALGPRLSGSQAAAERGPARRLAFQSLLVLLCVICIH